MRIVLFIILAFGMLANVPLPCAHALGGHNAEMAQPMDDMHAPMDHEMPMGEMGKSAGEQHDQHNGCKMDCDGGAGCDGCVTVAAWLNPIQLASFFEPIPTKQFFYFEAFNGITSAIELPPPRV